AEIGPRLGNVQQVHQADNPFELAAVHGPEQEDDRSLLAILACVAGWVIPPTSRVVVGRRAPVLLHAVGDEVDRALARGPGQHAYAALLQLLKRFLHISQPAFPEDGQPVLLSPNSRRRYQRKTPERCHGLSTVHWSTS